MKRALSGACGVLFVVLVFQLGCEPGAREPERGVETPPMQILGTADTTLMSGMFTKRLGEAADGFRTGDTVWIVASGVPPHEIYGAFPDSASAFGSLEEAGAGFGVYAFLSPTDFNRAGEVVVPCKRGKWTEWICPMRAEEVFLADSITGMTLTINTTAGPFTYPLDPDSVEAVFFSVAAIDRFVVPFYAKLVSPEYAKALRDSVRDVITRNLP